MLFEALTIMSLAALSHPKVRGFLLRSCYGIKASRTSILSSSSTVSTVTATNYGNPLPSVIHQTLEPSMMKPGRLLIVGDVHGCNDELETLLTKASFDPQSDNLIFVGDLVNKGPSSIKVIDTFLKHKALGVRGNHDDAALSRYRKWKASGKGKESVAIDKPEHHWVPYLEPHHVSVLEELPFTLSIPSHGIMVVHAGLIPGHKPSHPTDTSSGPRELWAYYKMRNLKPASDGESSANLEGEAVRGFYSLEKNKHGGEAWASVWPGPEHVVFGHDAKRKLQLESYATGLDSGCLYGGQLTLASIPPLKELSDAARAKIQRSLPLTREDLQITLLSIEASQAWVDKTGGGD
jgi:hypothetical protein